MFEEWRYCTIRNRTPNQGDWGRERGLLPILKEKVFLSFTCYWPKWCLLYIDINNKTEKRKAAYPVSNATSLLTAVNKPFLSINHWPRKMILLPLYISLFYIPQWQISLVTLSLVPFHISLFQAPKSRLYFRVPFTLHVNPTIWKPGWNRWHPKT